MSIASPGEPLRPAGGAARVEFTGEFYVGIGVTSHDVGRIDTAEFSDVVIGTPAQSAAGAPTTMVNTLETISIASGDRRVAYTTIQPNRLEAPNWFPDTTNTLYFNNDGKLFKVQTEPPGTPPNSNRLKVPEAMNLGILTNINNDHGITMDGKTWAISDQSQTLDGRRPSLIYTVPAAGGQATRVTDLGPSYFHGWSPDGKRLTYCGQRGNNFDIYTIAVEGGPETRLTTDAGQDDGPEYSPDGQYVYFNSNRSGLMQIWRMKTDGSEQTQITKDTDVESWFPHVSPNGMQMAYLAYETGAGNHPANKDVALRLMNLTTGAVRDLAKLFGGQGTINVNSWAPSSRYLAFVSYQIVPQSTSVGAGFSRPGNL